MEERKEAITISRADYESRLLSVDNKNIKIKNAIINQNNIEITKDLNNEEKIWVSIPNNLLLNQTNNALKDYKIRTNLIDLIVNKSIESEINGIVIDFKDIQTEIMQRFIIELTPKLREIGISTCIVLNNNIKKDDYINIVDYIVE